MELQRDRALAPVGPGNAADGPALLPRRLLGRLLLLTALVCPLHAGAQDAPVPGPATVPDRPPLHRAIADGDLARVEELLASGADPETVDASGSPALFVRPPCDDPAVTEALLARGADVDRRNDLGHTPLWSVALLGHTWTARVLLDAGADPDPRPDDGWTPLVVALLGGHLGTAAVLADAGAAVDVRLDDDRWLLERLAAEGDRAAVRFVLERGAGEGRDGALHTAAATGHAGAARILLAAGAEPEAPDPGGWTPLLLAARRGHAEVVDLLLEAGAAVDGLGTEASRSTPLLAASAARRGEVALRLLAAGADPEARNRSGVTPLMFAAHHGLESLAAELLAQGAEPGVANLDGKTALAFALLARRAGVLEVLLDDGGAEVDGKLHLAGFGRLTPLALAAGRGDADLVRILLAHGADPSRVGDVARFGSATPLILAAAGGHAEVVTLLLAHGADPDRPVAGRSARDWAREAEREEVLAWFDRLCPRKAGMASAFPPPGAGAGRGDPPPVARLPPQPAW